MASNAKLFAELLDTSTGDVLSSNLDNAVVTDWSAAVQTSSFTAAKDKGYFVNSTSGEINVTLPASPTKGDIVGIVDYKGTAATNNIIVKGNGSKIKGTNIDVLLTQNFVSVTLIFSDATQGWLAQDTANETATKALGMSFDVDALLVGGGGGCGEENG